MDLCVEFLLLPWWVSPHFLAHNNTDFLSYISVQKSHWAQVKFLAGLPQILNSGEDPPLAFPERLRYPLPFPSKPTSTHARTHACSTPSSSLTCLSPFHSRPHNDIDSTWTTQNNLHYLRSWFNTRKGFIDI